MQVAHGFAADPWLIMSERTQASKHRRGITQEA